jgi:tRNA A37 threonylcarbamoyladenosine biosynthesis protein TsaE
LVEEDAVALVEWGNLAAPALGESTLEVTLVAPDPVGSPDQRLATIVGRGRWLERADEVAAALDAVARPAPTRCAR